MASASSTVIPVEIVSEEEMAFLEAALASARPLISSLSPSSRRLLTSIRSTSSTHPPSPQFHPCAQIKDIEDSIQPPKSFLDRFRPRRALMVTDFTAAEWCEKQMEFALVHGKPERTAAMEAGSNRHAQLEKEVLERVEIRVESREESWALKFSNFILGYHQLLHQGLTRELPVIGVWGHTWITGVIDEIWMPLNEVRLNPILVDTKTRYNATLPSEAQKRNGRLQLMCYKYLWDGLVAGAFPIEYFFKHFELNPQSVLSEDVRQFTSSLGFHAKTFGDVVTYFRDTCLYLPSSQDQLLLRYELQSDCSLLDEYQFAYDAGWFGDQMDAGLEFWLGHREANFVPKAETWKCRFCKFSDMCPMTTESSSTTGQDGRICSS